MQAKWDFPVGLPSITFQLLPLTSSLYSIHILFFLAVIYSLASEKYDNLFVQEAEKRAEILFIFIFCLLLDNKIDENKLLYHFVLFAKHKKKDIEDRKRFKLFSFSTLNSFLINWFNHLVCFMLCCKIK